MQHSNHKVSTYRKVVYAILGMDFHSDLYVAFRNYCLGLDSVLGLDSDLGSFRSMIINGQYFVIALGKLGVGLGGVCSGYSQGQIA